MTAAQHWHFQILAQGKDTDKLCTDDLGVGLAAISEATGVFQVHGSLISRSPGGTHCLACRRVEAAKMPPGIQAARLYPGHGSEATTEAYINLKRDEKVYRNPV